MKQIDAIILEQGATTDRQLVDRSNRLFSNNLQYVCCIKTAINLCISCVLATFSKDDDDDDDDDDVVVVQASSRSADNRDRRYF